jgi:hypothetical protein
MLCCIHSKHALTKSCFRQNNYRLLKEMCHFCLKTVCSYAAVFDDTYIKCRMVSSIALREWGGGKFALVTTLHNILRHAAFNISRLVTLCLSLQRVKGRKGFAETRLGPSNGKGCRGVGGKEVNSN